ITVANTNDAPTFTSTPVTAATEDDAYSYGVTVADVDPTSQNLTITGTVVPAWLTLNVTGNGTPAASAILTGTPTNADVGDHTVTLTVSDGVTSVDQTFTITIAAVNDAPSVTVPASITVFEDTPLVLTGISVADPDAGSGNVTLTLAVDAGALSATAGGGVAVGGTPAALTLSGTLTALNTFLAAVGVTYTPGAAAVATLSVTADDGGNTGSGGALQSPAATVGVAVTAVNDAPGFAAGPDQSTTASPAPRAVAGWATGISAGLADEAGQTLAFEVTVDRPELFAVPPAIDPARGALTYTPAPGATGTATVTVRLRDNGGTANGGQDVSAAQTFAITLTPVPPLVAVGGSASGAVSVFNADGTVAFSVPSGGASDPRVATGDVTGDGVADLVVGTGSGGVAGFRVIDGATRATVRTVQAFEAAFTGGVFLAVGDVDGDGFADVAASADATGGGRVTVFGGRDGAVLANFFGIGDPDFRGGARVAFGDVNGDGTPDLVVTAGPGGGPRVAVFDGRTLAPGATPTRLVNDFFALDPALRDGAYVAAGDIDGDGFAEVIVTAGLGGGPRVFAADGRSLVADGSGGLLPRANFFAADPGLRTGARVAAKDIDGDGQADLAVGLTTAAGPVVRLYLGRDVPAGGTPPVYRELTDLGDDLLLGVFVG
ncbi:FG-GAP repeat protein, partial [bacterium]|nr:FG-GAP repeat protein [bacterium]